MRGRLKRLFPYAVATLAVIFVAIQFVPYGHPAPNPPTRREPNWDSPRTRELVARACFDCHSNQTRYPWYSYVAPVSWLVAHDVQGGEVLSRPAAAGVLELRRLGIDLLEVVLSLPQHARPDLSAGPRTISGISPPWA